MLTIDEIKIEGEEDGFHLIVYTDDAEPVRYRIGLPDQFHAETVRTIGRWLAEGEAARATTPSDFDGGDAMLRHSDGTPYMDAFDYTDPKHPDYHDTMSGIHDNRKGK